MSVMLAGLVAWLGAWWLASGRSPLAIHDRPNARSLHAHPTPRTGGLAILAGVGAGMLWLRWQHGLGIPAHLVAAAGLVAAVSLWDDLRDLSPLVRLAVHGLAAWVLAAGMTAGQAGALWVAITAFGVVWMINLYNFMDGMDGLAGGMSLIGFGAMALAGWQAGAFALAWFCGVVAAAALGFLALNRPPARLFMGDVGAATLGCLAAGCALWGMRDGVFGLWFSLLAFSPFIVDATVTLVRRGLRGEKVWRAHREHYYQRLVLAGWGHAKTLMAELGLMLAAAASALWLLRHPEWRLAGGVAWAAAYAALMWAAGRAAGKCPQR